MSPATILLVGLVILVGFAFVHWGFLFAVRSVRRPVAGAQGRTMSRACRCWRRWRSIFLFLATPVTNSITRTTEHQADIFGLDAVRKPDAFATVMLKLSTYRKLEPGKWEEIDLLRPSLRPHPHRRLRCAGRRNISRDPDIRDTARRCPD